MKAKLKKIVVPMVVVLIAVTGAFASNLSKQDDATLMDRTGFIRSGSVCISTSVTCSTIIDPLYCSDGVNILHDWNGTGCPLALYRKAF